MGNLHGRYVSSHNLIKERFAAARLKLVATSGMSFLSLVTFVLFPFSALFLMKSQVFLCSSLCDETLFSAHLKFLAVRNLFSTCISFKINNVSLCQHDLRGNVENLA